MRYDIATFTQKYRGMERSLLATDLLNSKSKKEFDNLLEEYFSFLEYSENVNMISVGKTIHFYKKLRKFDIPCEVIVYDNKPLNQFFGYSLELLGIDVVHDMCESLISDDLNPHILHLLNENGLCKTELDVKKIISYQDHGDVEWGTCYVYKIKLID